MSSTRKNHHFVQSLPYNAAKGCPAGYHKRMTYKSSTGKVVPARCVRATTRYAETSREFKSRTLKKPTMRLTRAGITATTVNARKACPPGQLLRKAYVRKYSANVRAKGYIVKRGDTTYRAYPKVGKMIVPAACIKDQGKAGKGPQAIGPLRRGELLKHGYSYRKPADERRTALKKATKEFGVLGVYRKLNAVAKLSVRTAPQASKVFKADRDWVRATMGPLKAF